MDVGRVRAFPACAGMNRPGETVTGDRDGVPRVCGDEPVDDVVMSEAEQRSPRVRG